MDNDKLGQRLRARRTDLDLTLAEVADRAGLSLPYVSNLERGRGNPTLEAIGAIAAALETPLSALMPDDQDIDPVQLVLAEAPASLRRFVRTQRFGSVVDTLAREQGVEADAMRRRLLVAMASAPRRSAGEPTDDDWKRLLDVYSVILRDQPDH